MPRVDRHQLRFGPYRTPRFKYGARVECEVRGEVTIIGLSDGPIPWLVGKTQRATSMASRLCSWWTATRVKFWAPRESFAARPERVGREGTCQKQRIN